MKRLLTLFLFATTLLAQTPASRSGRPGTISGRLVSRDGVPAANVRIVAVEVGTPLFPDSQALASITQTDGAGHYRLEDVPTGRYFIVAGLLDLPTYFPGVTTEGTANIVTVTSAANLTGVDFNMVIAAGLRFSGKVINQDNTGKTIAPAGPLPGQQPGQAPQIRLVGQNTPAQAQTAAVGADGTFDFTQVRPGTYRIQVSPSPPSMPQLSVTLLDNDITGYELFVPLMVRITGIVSVEEDLPAPRFQIVFSNANDPLAPVGPASRVQTNAVGAAGNRFINFNVQVPAGANRVTTTNLPSGFTIKKIVAGEVDLAVAPLVVTANGAPPIQIVLSAATAPWVRITGHIAGRGAGNSGGAITITATQPAAGLPALSSPLQVTTYLDGSFEIPKALPGTYRVSGAGQAEFDVPGGVAEFRGAVIDVGSGEGVNSSPVPGAPSSAVRVRGHIIGRAKAQANAEVRLVDIETSESRSARIYVDGSFEFAGIQPGHYLAEVMPRLPGAMAASLDVGKRDIRDFQLTVPSTRDIEGRVSIDGAGALPRSLVFLVGLSRISTPVQADGSFNVTLPEGLSRGLAADELPDGYVPSIVDEQRVVLKVTKGTGSVAGRVTGDIVSPNDVRVWLTDAAGRQRTTETTLRPDRTFVFSDVVAGGYKISLVGAGRTVSTDVMVNFGVATNLELKATPQPAAP